jgi:hypothetical protein
MKRLLSAIALLLLPIAAFAFDASPRAVKVAVLVPADDVQSAVGAALVEALRNRGIDAFEAGLTYDDAYDRGVEADYAVEIIAGDTRSVDYGGAAIGARHADISLGVVGTRVDADLRLYDGDTMELLASEPIKHKTTALLPTGVGVGGRAVFAWIALPFVERVQARGVVRAAAREAAEVVADAIGAR